MIPQYPNLAMLLLEILVQIFRNVNATDVIHTAQEEARQDKKKREELLNAVKAKEHQQAVEMM
jgi:hypothetical protein